MAVLPIIKLGHSSLRKRAQEIPQINDQVIDLAENMIDTMQVNEGIGLAGPQVNELKRIFVIDLSLIEADLSPGAFVNPKILSTESTDTMEEGCLSIPDVRADVIRPYKIDVEYQTLEGKTVRETMEGLLARVFQHELDHLNGVLFIDKISALQKKALASKIKYIKEGQSII
ncbi:MAG: peptide deformylase [Calditrichae bacterium]|nr:peptide deformylase [Calditrichia bacterium]NIV73172.1 peptide deformylase [Calditrichia bacterium]